MSCESLVIDGCESLVLEVEAPVLLEVAEQGPPGPPGAPGEPGPPGTTDYNDLINKPTLGTAAAQNVEAFASASALSTTNSNVGSLSTSTSSGLNTATSSIASLSTGLSTALSSGLSTTNSGVASLSTSTSSGLSTASSRISSLSSSASAGLSTATSGIASLSTALSSTSSSVGSLSTSASSGLSTSASGISSLSTSTSTALSTAASNVGALDTQNVKLAGVQSITGVKSFAPPLTGASGTSVGATVAPAVAQSGTAGFTALDVAPTSSSTGSGNLLLQRWGYNGVTYGSLRSTGAFATRGSVTAGSTDGMTAGTSYLNALGSFAVDAVALSASTTLGITHGTVAVNAASGAIVITLPAVSTCRGRVYPLKRIDGTVANLVSIVPNGVELIDGRSVYFLERQYSGVVLKSDGSRWLIESITEPADVARGSPVINLMSDSGKMTARANPLSLTAGAFDAAKMTLWFAPFNGAGAWAEAGKFIFDNSTNGGAGGALTTTTQDLIAAMGRTGAAARYGTEFYIAERTAGGATGVPHPQYPGNYLGCVMNSTVQGVMNADKAVTFVGWVRAIDGNQLVVGATGPTQAAYLNGVRIPGSGSGVAVTPAMGWAHVRIVIRSALGYENSAPRIYTEPGQKYQTALPAWMFGEANPGIHTAPIQTINELIP